MKEISLKELKAKGWRLSEESQQAITFSKTIKALEKIVSSLDRITKSPTPVVVSVKQDETILNDLKEALQNLTEVKNSRDKTGGDFEIVVTDRDSYGLIKKVVVRGV